MHIGQGSLQEASFLLLRSSYATQKSLPSPTNPQEAIVSEALALVKMHRVSQEYLVREQRLRELQSLGAPLKQPLKRL